MDKKVNHWYIHADLDAFFASVEQLDHPEYRGKPVIVGGKPEDRRGVVSTASYEARKFGVHSAMPTFQAYKLCPQGIFVHGNYRRYQEISYQVMTIFRDFSPDVDQMSIDEAFIDLTGTERLFGPPEETAIKIKERVKQETGLTISIGLAASKYIAKIASGHSKPDGFYFVKHGDECKFMLSLPLNKVWGCGQKTLENLNKKGIRTTKDLFQKDLDYLTLVFGENTGKFLYNSVRGLDNNTFTNERKSHSISNEKTFAYDIYDPEIAKAYLLELSHNVLFRLLKEKSFSKTIFLKIRYSDFSTTSIQEKESNYVETVDDFYNKITRLFDKKYINGRGIRLLGLGFDNVEENDNNRQFELFDQDKDKKKKIEEAILKLEEKHPEIKIRKASILGNITKSIILTSIIGILSVFYPFSYKSYAQNITNTQGTLSLLPDTLQVPNQNEIPETLFSFSLNDQNNVDFLINGYWNAQFENSMLFNFGNEKELTFSMAPPIFKQEVELYTWLFLNKEYYFEADFADEFEKNTFAFGYQGKGYLQSLRLSNRNIRMPDSYSSNFFAYGLGGGNNQAPGISLHFSDILNNKWTGDFLLRYDMTNSKSATFYGLNKVSDDKIEISDYVYGQSFILPSNQESYAKEIKNVYVENSDGNYKDSNNKRYIKLSNTQYSIFQSENKIIISYSAKAGKSNSKIPGVLLTFNESATRDNIINSMGSYSDSESFLGQIQNYFNSNNKKNYNLEDFAYNLKTSIEDSPALVIQNSSGFSPFINANIYDCGIIENADAYIISKSSEQISEKYAVQLMTDEISNISEDFFYKNHKYVEILINDSDSQNEVENRYPLAATNPEIYLNLSNTSDLCLLVRTYTSVSSFEIGSDASADSVRVYINGIIDRLAKYDEDSGTVILSKSVNEMDKIYICWQEDSKDNSGGLLAIGAGFTYDLTNNLKTDTSLTFKYPLSTAQNYTSSENPLNGFTALSLGLDYKNTFGNSVLALSEKTAFSLETENPTGTLLALSQSDLTAETYYLSQSCGYSTKVSPQLNVEEVIILEDENKGNIDNYSGQTDSKISGYKIPLEWDFSNLDSQNKNWASCDVKLSSGSYLKSSSMAEFSFLPSFTNEINKDAYDIYLQLGIQAGQEDYGEDRASISTWKINERNSKTITSLDISKNEWQTIKIILEDSDKAKLISNYDLRLIVVNNSENDSGCIYIGPYSPIRDSLQTSQNQNIYVATDNILSDSPSAKKLFQTEAYTSRIKWEIENPDLISDSESATITAIDYFTSADFSKYKYINIDFSLQGLESSENELFSTDENQLTFILDNQAESDESNNSIALEINLHDISSYINQSQTFHTLTINTQNNKVYLDSNELSSKEYSLTINKNQIPNRLRAEISTNIGNMLYTKGIFCLDNLYYQESWPSFLMQNYLSAQYNYQETFLYIKNFSLFRDGQINITSLQAGNFESIDGQNNVNASIDSSAEGKINIAGIDFSANISTYYSHDTKNEDIITYSGYKIKNPHPLFKFLTFEESYNYNHQDSSIGKNDKIELTFSPLKVPLSFWADFQAKQNNNVQNQKGDLGGSLLWKSKNYSGNISATVKTEQKLLTSSSEVNEIEVDNYFENWKDITLIQYSLGMENAYLRTVNYNFTFSNDINFINLKPVFEYTLKSNYKGKNSYNFLDTSIISLKIPFAFVKNSFYFNLSHTAIGLQNTSSKDYLTDSRQLFALYPSRSFFYSAIPFYELFDKNLSSNILLAQNNNSTDYLLYSSKYELGWKRRLSNNFWDLLIPSSTNFTVSRDLKASRGLSDLYQFKLSANNMAFNIFGAKSNLQLFNWYQQDEIISNLTGLVKVPYDLSENTVFQITSYLQLILYFQEKYNNLNNLKIAGDLSLASDNDYSYRFTTIWSRGGKFSLLVEIISLFYKKSLNQKITIKDTLNLDFKNSDSLTYQSYEYIHKNELALLKYYTLNYEAGFVYKHTKDSGDSLKLKLTIGGKMEF